MDVPPTVELFEPLLTNNLIDQNPCSTIVSNEQSFDISFKNKLFSIEISTGKKEEMEYILFKGYEKSTVSKFIYSKDYTSDELKKMSKSFKIFDDFTEIYAMLLQKFEDNEVQLTLNEDLYLNLEFILPNKKIDKISFILKKEKIKDSELIEKLFENIAFLQEKNKSLQEQITKIITKKKPKSFIDIISNKFKQAKVSLLNELYKNLKGSDLKDEYLKEILNKFQSKTKTIYNIKKDEDTIQGIVAKILGKKNLAGYFLCHNKDGEKSFYDSNFAYLDGKLELENGYLSFLTKGVFAFGTYYGVDNVGFILFRDNEAKIYIKIEKDFVFFIIYQSSKSIKCIIKINEHFGKNPIFISNYFYNDKNLSNDELINVFESSLKNEKENKNKGKSVEIKQKDENSDKETINEKNKKDEDIEITEYYLKELKVYQAEN